MVRANQGPARNPLNQFSASSYGEFKACCTARIKSVLFANIHHHKSVGIPTSSRLTGEVRKVLGREDSDNTEGVCVWERQGGRRLHQAKTLKPALILNL